jgi:hypothetical protein
MRRVDGVKVTRLTPGDLFVCHELVTPRGVAKGKLRAVGWLDSAEAARDYLAAVEATSHPHQGACQAGIGIGPCGQVSLQWPRSVVECRRKPYAPGCADLSLAANGTHKPYRRASKTRVLFVNRRIPTGTYGGVGAGGG